MKLAIILPALNEELALPLVLSDLKRVIPNIPDLERSEIIVADNGSTDRTMELAKAGGALVVAARPRGYGSACLKALSTVNPQTDTIVFMDADHSDFAEDLPVLLEPLRKGAADLVIGARRPIEAGALTIQQRVGNALACTLIGWLYGYRYTDLGPFRVIRRDALNSAFHAGSRLWLDRRNAASKKALKKNLRVCEVPVRYRARIGQSKISGTLLGSFRAGQTILWTIAKSFAW